MTAPEPVEVAADELAAAEPAYVQHVRSFLAGKTLFFDWMSFQMFTEQYDRLRAEVLRERQRGNEMARKLDADLAAENVRLRAFLLEATGTLPAYGFADSELGDPWPRWLERVAAYLTETHDGQN